MRFVRASTTQPNLLWNFITLLLPRPQSVDSVSVRLQIKTTVSGYSLAEATCSHSFLSESRSAICSGINVHFIPRNRFFFFNTLIFDLHLFVLIHHESKVSSLLKSNVTFSDLWTYTCSPKESRVSSDHHSRILYSRCLSHKRLARFSVNSAQPPTIKATSKLLERSSFDQEETETRRC